MIPGLVIEVIALITIVAVAFRQNTGPRIRQLQLICVGAFVAVSIRQSPLTDIPLFDLLKRLGLLAVAVAAVFLVVGFRKSRPPRWVNRGIVACAVIIAVAQSALLQGVPVHPDGAIFLPAEARQAHAIAGMVYYLLYLVPPFLALLVVLFGVIHVWRRSGQRTIIRILMTPILLSMGLGVVFFISAGIDLIAPLGDILQPLHDTLLLAVIALLLIAITGGIVYRGALFIQVVLAIAVSLSIVNPMWTRLTRRFPEVVLPAEDDPQPVLYAARLRLIRRVVETNDAIALLRHSLAVDRGDPILLRAIAATDTDLAPLTASPHIVSRLKHATLPALQDPALTQSIRDLCELRDQCAGHAGPHTPLAA